MSAVDDLRSLLLDYARKAPVPSDVACGPWSSSNLATHDLESDIKQAAAGFIDKHMPAQESSDASMSDYYLSEDCRREYEELETEVEDRKSVV